MSGRQIDHLIKMAEQIVLNMAPWGDAAAEKTADHMRRFWTPAMRGELLDHWRSGGEGLSPELLSLLAAENEKNGEPSI